jgi:hypothetical protein
MFIVLFALISRKLLAVVKIPVQHTRSKSLFRLVSSAAADVRIPKPMFRSGCAANFCKKLYIRTL